MAAGTGVGVADVAVDLDDAAATIGNPQVDAFLKALTFGQTVMLKVMVARAKAKVKGLHASTYAPRAENDDHAAERRSIQRALAEASEKKKIQAEIQSVVQAVFDREFPNEASKEKLLRLYEASESNKEMVRFEILKQAALAVMLDETQMSRLLPAAQHIFAMEKRLLPSETDRAAFNSLGTVCNFIEKMRALINSDRDATRIFPMHDGVILFPDAVIDALIFALGEKAEQAYINLELYSVDEAPVEHQKAVDQITVLGAVMSYNPNVIARLKSSSDLKIYENYCSMAITEFQERKIGGWIAGDIVAEAEALVATPVGVATSSGDGSGLGTRPENVTSEQARTFCQELAYSHVYPGRDCSSHWSNYHTLDDLKADDSAHRLITPQDIQKQIGRRRYYELTTAGAVAAPAAVTPPTVPGAVAPPATFAAAAGAAGAPASEAVAGKKKGLQRSTGSRCLPTDD